jgi:hypothetical protein
LVIALAIAFSAMLLVDWSGVDITISDFASGRILWRRTVPPGERIELHYVHSVERTPIVEVYRADVDGLWFVEMRFVSQGAGLPTEGYTREGDHFVLRATRRIGALPLRVSAVAHYYATVRGERVDLVRLAGDRAALSLSSHRSAPRLRLPGPR